MTVTIQMGEHVVLETQVPVGVNVYKFLVDQLLDLWIAGHPAAPNLTVTYVQ